MDVSDTHEERSHLHLSFCEKLGLPNENTKAKLALPTDFAY